MNLLLLPRQRVVNRGKPFAPFTIPDPDYRIERGDRAFLIVYGALPQDPQYFALSPRMALDAEG